MQPAFNEQQLQQQLLLTNFNGHMRSLSNSNCSGNVLPNNTLSNFSTHQNLLLHQQTSTGAAGAGQSAQAAALRGITGMAADQRKAPSSINLLNNTCLTSNLNTSNLLMPSNQGRVNLANANNVGAISMTHQNLLLQPQRSAQLTAQQMSENNVSEQQLAESEDCYEKGKQCLQELKHKEASKLFTQSLAANPTNYDALFYRAVANLDQE